MRAATHRPHLTAVQILTYILMLTALFILKMFMTAATALVGAVTLLRALGSKPLSPKVGQALDKTVEPFHEIFVELPMVLLRLALTFVSLGMLMMPAALIIMIEQHLARKRHPIEVARSVKAVIMATKFVVIMFMVAAAVTAAVAGLT